MPTKNLNAKRPRPSTVNNTAKRSTSAAPIETLHYDPDLGVGLVPVFNVNYGQRRGGHFAFSAATTATTADESRIYTVHLNTENYVL